MSSHIFMTSYICMLLCVLAYVHAYIGTCVCVETGVFLHWENRLYIEVCEIYCQGELKLGFNLILFVS